jgi:hypothetical protein
MIAQYFRKTHSITIHCKVMSLQESPAIPTTINWPKGTITNFLILPVPNVSPVVIDRALEFICGNCIYYDKEHKKKTLFVLPGITDSKKVLSKPIVLEALFREAVG